MIPLKDDLPSRIFPLITVSLIVLNSLVFFYQMSLGRSEEVFVFKYGAVPWEITHHMDRNPTVPFPVQGTLFTSIFLHGGLFHLIGNMLYLWIFGNNIEDAMGHLRFLIFYVVCGVIAAISHILTSPHSQIPMIGASGAISGVLGAYILLHPRAKVLTLLILGPSLRAAKIPALWVLGFWIILQLINGALSLGLKGDGGVAWFAHIGGFIAGLFLIHFFKKEEKP